MLFNPLTDKKQHLVNQAEKIMGNDMERLFSVGGGVQQPK